MLLVDLADGTYEVTVCLANGDGLLLSPNAMASTYVSPNSSPTALESKALKPPPSRPT